jgi:nicotinamidase-related amidase
LKTSLVVIDGQIDFIEGGALPVTGGTKALDNIVNFINKHNKDIYEINATLDSHHYRHIAHPVCWVDEHGNHPYPFPDFTNLNAAPVIITLADIDAGKWRSSHPKLQQTQREYVELLEQSKNRFPLIIWNPHCIIGTQGHALYPPLSDILNQWESEPRLVDFVTKGSNWKREHYSAIKAEVIDPKDPVNTGLNTKMIERIVKADRVIWTGLASSHCLNYTFRDTVEETGDDLVKKFIIFEDCTKAVTGFEKEEQEFFDFARSKGAKVMKSTEF